MSIRLEDFKKTKRELKNINNQIAEFFEQIDDERNFGKLWTQSLKILNCLIYREKAVDLAESEEKCGLIREDRKLWDPLMTFDN